jgi:hypothetical protein
MCSAVSNPSVDLSSAQLTIGISMEHIQLLVACEVFTTRNVFGHNLCKPQTTNVQHQNQLNVMKHGMSHGNGAMEVNPILSSSAACVPVVCSLVCPKM